MSHLIVIALGPVQDFIMRARRTRDLWFGSFLLSEMSKAAARAIQDCGYTLIFPHAPDLSSLLEPCTDSAKLTLTPSMIFPRAPDLSSLLEPCTDDAKLTLTPSISNVVLAMGGKSACPPDIAAQSARAAADACWQGWADKTHQACEGLLRPNNTWNAQIQDALEFYAVWVPLKSEADYRSQRQRLMELLAGRKLVRDFQASSDTDSGLPKSSLDGSRETVLDVATEVEKFLLKNFALAYRLRLRYNEQLSAIDLVKRAATKEAFPSVTRVALDPWIRGVGKDNLTLIADLCNKLLEHSEKEDKAQVSGNGWRYSGIYQDFRYDGQLLLKDRVAAALRQTDELVLWNKEILKAIQEKLPALYKDYGIPDPYLAVLVADGDGMGEILSDCQSPQQHQAISSALNDFAEAARTAIRQRFHGVCIFAGGEDILALLPVDRALCCAEYLRTSYSASLAGSGACGATLSVGVAVGHCLESLEDLRAWAQDAEKAAKNKVGDYAGGAGNALAIHYYPRGGVPRILRGRWGNVDLHQRLHHWAKWLNKGWLPNKAAYDLETLARQYMRAGGDELAWTDKAAAAREAIVAEACRLFTCKGVDKDEKPAMYAQFKTTLQAAMAEDPKQPQRVALHLAQEWQFAALLALKQRQARGEKSSKVNSDD